MKFINRIIAVLLCIAMISAFACLSVSALTLLPVGPWIYHEINDYKEVEIYEYNGEDASVFTPYSNNLLPITTVGANAFDGNSTLTTLTLSKYITTVSHHAFLNCSALETVKFQSISVTTIDDYAFAGCSSLSSISLENTLIDTVSKGVFMSCESLAEVTLPDTVTNIESQAFAYCDNLSKVLIPATVTTIADDAFYASENTVIYCYENSAAHVYAENYSIDYVLIDEKEKYILGDADGDGMVSVIDATYIQLTLAQKIEKSEGFDYRADCDGDGTVSVMDATNVQYYMAGLLLDTDIGNKFEY